MENKLLWSLDEIASNIGVHKNTVRRRFKAYKELMSKNGQRKRFYSPNERDMIISLFKEL